MQVSTVTSHSNTTLPILARIVHPHEPLYQRLQQTDASPRLTTHCHSGSSGAVVHESQLPKCSLVVVLKKQLLLVCFCLSDLKVTAFYDVEVVAFLSFPEYSYAMFDCILGSGLPVCEMLFCRRESILAAR